MGRKPIRRALTAREVASFLLKNPDALVYAAPSWYNVDEPDRTKREFVDHDRTMRVAAIEYGEGCYTIGYVEE